MRPPPSPPPAVAAVAHPVVSAPPAPAAAAAAVVEPRAPLAEAEPPVPGVDDEPPPAWLDEQAESAFRAEARDRGESVFAPRPAEDAAEEPETDALPKLDELVARIPAEVRETLEDLFRARFVAVKRVPKKTLKA